MMYYEMIRFDKTLFFFLVFYYMTFIEQPHYIEDDPPEELFVFFSVFILNDF